MFKQIQSGLAKFFTKERMLIIFIFILFSWVLLSYSGSKKSGHEGFELPEFLGGGSKTPTPDFSTPLQPAAAASAGSSTVIPSVQPSTSSMASEVDKTTSPFLQQTASPADLLPKDHNSQWAALNPNAMNQGNLALPDLLLASQQLMSIDTIGQTLRNPNLQLRSEPLIPKHDTGPWNMSTIEPDVGRVPLELGEAQR